MKATPLLNLTYAGSDGLYPVIVRVEHRGKRRAIPTGYRVKKEQWKSGRVIKHGDALLINAAISNTLAGIAQYLADCRLRNREPDIDLVGKERASYSFTEYLARRAQQYLDAGKIIMHRKVSRFQKELTSCAGGNVYFEDVHLDFLRQLEQWQRDQGNGQNTRHKKFKFLREFYGQAMLEGKAPAPNPFVQYKIAQTPTAKRKLIPEQIISLETVAVSGPLALARDLFLFAYYCNGLRFGECILLRPENITGGRIITQASKGKKHLSIRIHPRLQSLIDRQIPGDFIFPCLKEIPADPKALINTVGSWNAIINRDLKAVGRLAGISTPLTFHMSRHAFAYHLMQKTDSIHVIKDAIGHSSYRTTEIYLQGLDQSIIDNETAKVYGG